MDSGCWPPIGSATRSKFRGPFDVVMSFFYVPNLALAELYLSARRMPRHPVVRISAAIALNAATLFVLVGTYYFLRYYWGPGIVGGLAELTR